MTELTFEKKDGLALLVLNRPDKLNALNDELFVRLTESLQSIEKDDSLRGVVITGEGKAFCAGADINVLARANAVTGRAFAQRGQAVFDQIEAFSKPVVAAVNGFCFGGGCELAMSAHLRLASPKAKFGQPEIKLGVIPGYGGTQRLSRLIGRGRALELCLTGEFVSAQRGYELGLVNQVVEGDLITEAMAYLGKITQYSALPIESLLETINMGSDLPMREAQALEAAHFGVLCGSQDKAEGVAAFLEKRDPDFTDQ